MFDYLIVGAGFAGATLAQKISHHKDKKVLVIEQRNHIAGNAYDFFDESGILVHKYGPHIFHTNSKEVWDYLSRFTKWRPYEHRVLASVDGQLLPIPINLTTYNKYYNTNYNQEEFGDILSYFANQENDEYKNTNSETVVIGKVGRELYEKFFKNYTIKQWGLEPKELAASVCARIPVRRNSDDRYFSDKYQAMPLFGYSKMFENMLSGVPILLNTTFKEFLSMKIPYKNVIFTGPIDEFYNYKYGKLPYRSLKFIHETHDKESYQLSASVNYPNDNDYTRVTEFKKMTGQEHPKTSIVFEYPSAEGDPYYPIPRPENEVIYQKYKQDADLERNVFFCGRLATYKYLNMDQAVAQALTLFNKKIMALKFTGIWE